MTFEELLKRAQEDVAEILNGNDCAEILDAGECDVSPLVSSVFHHIPSGRFLRLTWNTFEQTLQNVVEVEPKIVTKTVYVERNEKI